MEPVLIVSTGIANTASVAAAFRRIGAETELTDSPDRVRSAHRVVLPGVGSFGAGMHRLHDLGLDEAIRDRVLQGRPLLAICLGLQLLCLRSEESPGVNGIGVLNAEVRRLPAGVRAPQFGWNWVKATDDSLVRDGYAYYANSYCVTELPIGWTNALSNYGEQFIGAVELGPVLACQFHPELSGEWGCGLIKRWFTREVAGAPC